MIHTINPPVWRYPNKEVMGKVIIAIDRQKPWERVIDYSERVLALFRTQNMSEKYDYRFMGRVFLGGLNPNILNLLLEAKEIPFREAFIHAEFLEQMLQCGTIYCHHFAGEDLGAAVAGSPYGDAPGDGVLDDGAQNGVDDEDEAMGAVAVAPSIVQDGEEIFGEPNEKVDQVYNARYVLILYR